MQVLQGSKSYRFLHSFLEFPTVTLTCMIFSQLPKSHHSSGPVASLSWWPPSRAFHTVERDCIRCWREEEGSSQLQEIPFTPGFCGSLQLLLPAAFKSDQPGGYVGGWKKTSSKCWCPVGCKRTSCFLRTADGLLLWVPVSPQCLNSHLHHLGPQGTNLGWKVSPGKVEEDSLQTTQSPSVSGIPDGPGELN